MRPGNDNDEQNTVDDFSRQGAPFPMQLVPANRQQPLPGHIRAVWGIYICWLKKLLAHTLCVCSSSVE
jgi:hypothetical protein